MAGRTDLAHERHEVVLAEGEKLDVLHDDHLVVVLGKDGALHCVGYLRAWKELRSPFCYVKNVNSVNCQWYVTYIALS